MVLSIYRSIALGLAVLKVVVASPVDRRGDIPEQLEAFNQSPSIPRDEPPTPPSVAADGVVTPQPTQPGMVGNCNKFYFVQPNQGCTEVALINGITFAQLLEWNTAIGSGCTGLWANVNVCVGIVVSTPTPTPTPSPSSATPTPTPTPSSSSSTPVVTPSPTVPSSTPPTTPSPTNGITTPLPTQPGMVGNCDRFYFVKVDDGCQSIANRYSISLSDFQTWNPSVGSTCSGLWANAYVCVRVIASSSPTPTPTPTTTPTPTAPGNGIVTPTPTQAGMYYRCNRFHFVKTGDSCDSLTTLYSLPRGAFVAWNPAVGQDCTGLWANTYACVGLGNAPYTSTVL